MPDRNDRPNSGPLSHFLVSTKEHGSNNGPPLEGRSCGPKNGIIGRAVYLIHIHTYTYIDTRKLGGIGALGLAVKAVWPTGCDPHVVRK